MSKEVQTHDSRFSEQSFSLDWNISNFGYIPYAHLPSLSSPIFKLGGISSQVCWHLKIYKRRRDGEEAIGFNIDKEEGSELCWYYIKMSISLVANGMSQVCLINAIFTEPTNDVLYIRKRDFEEENLDLLKAIDVRVVCNIMYTFQEDKISQIEDDGSSVLRHNLERLYKTKLHSDITLVAESTRINAHKCILSCRGFNRSLITDEMTVLDLNMKPSVAIAMLDYIYLGKTPSSVSEVADLFKSINNSKYGLVSLKQRCEFILVVNKVDPRLYSADPCTSDEESTSNEASSSDTESCSDIRQGKRNFLDLGEENMYCDSSWQVEDLSTSPEHKIRKLE